MRVCLRHYSDALDNCPWRLCSLASLFLGALVGCPGSAAQARRELVFRTAGRAGRRIERHPLGRPHAQRDHRAAIAAHVIGIASAAEQRLGRLGGGLIGVAGRRSRNLQRNGRHRVLPFSIASGPGQDRVSWSSRTMRSWPSDWLFTRYWKTLASSGSSRTTLNCPRAELIWCRSGEKRTVCPIANLGAVIIGSPIECSCPPRGLS